jgi:hypothetical protein
MALRSFEFDGKDLYKDFGCYIDSVTESPPEKNSYKATIPYRHGTIDFSELYGEPTFADRELVYTVDVVEDDEESLELAKMELENWLLTAPRGNIYDSALPDWHFVGTCTGIEEMDEVEKNSLTITFECYPFRVKNIPEGDIIWDSFCFLTDVWNELNYEVSGDAAVEAEIFNQGGNSQYASISVSGEITIKFEGIESKWISGNYNDVFLMKPGKNIFNIFGDGNVRFSFVTEKL